MNTYTDLINSKWLVLLCIVHLTHQDCPIQRYPFYCWEMSASCFQFLNSLLRCYQINSKTIFFPAHWSTPHLQTHWCYLLKSGTITNLPKKIYFTNRHSNIQMNWIYSSSAPLIKTEFNMQLPSIQHTNVQWIIENWKKK